MSSSLDAHKEESLLTNSEISKMIEHIQDMNPNEHEQIFNILKEHSCRYTENLNGVFINLAHVPNSVLKNIQSVIQFWQDQQTHIQEHEEQRMLISHTQTEEDDDVIHRSAVSTDSNTIRSTTSTTSTQMFNESTICQKKLTQKELQIVRGANAKKKITLTKGGKDILKHGGSALRVAKKCLATDEEI